MAFPGLLVTMPCHLQSLAALLLVVWARQALGWAYLRDDGVIRFISQIEINPDPQTGKVAALSFAKRKFTMWNLALSQGEDNSLDLVSTTVDKSVFSALTDGTLSVPNDLRLGGRLLYGTSSNYVRETTTTEVSHYVANVRSLTVKKTGGILHGTWNADNAVMSSDERLKTNIAPLNKHLNDAALRHGIPPASGAADADRSIWVLNQLRPISFNYRRASESNHTRFGFIAQDLERILPELVRTSDSEDGLKDKKSVAYQDIIPVLVAAGQSQQRKIERLEFMLQEQAHEQKRNLDQFAQQCRALDSKFAVQQKLELEEQAPAAQGHLEAAQAEIASSLGAPQAGMEMQVKLLVSEMQELRAQNAGLQFRVAQLEQAHTPDARGGVTAL